MRLYKFDYKGTIGNNVMTVPTDSQFLIGISNGDASSTAQLFDGDTEILPEDSKIGEYTCFRMETQGTQFRKPYKAIINGNNFETKALWDVSFDEVDYHGYGTVGLVLPENINPEDLNYHNENHLTSFQVYVYGIRGPLGSLTSYKYFKTITLTWNASKMAYEVPEDFGNDVVKYIQFMDCTPNYIYIGYGWESGTDGDSEFDEKETVPAPIPYTQNIDLYIICKKMSVSYRDETGLTPTEVVQAVKDSGEFIGKNEFGQYAAIGAFHINSGNGKLGVLSIEGSAPDYVPGLELDMDEENEEVDAYGTIDGQDLRIRHVILETPTIASFVDEDGAEFTPMEITVKIHGVEKTVLVLAQEID